MAMVKDVVCGMQVSEEHAKEKKLVNVFDGREYFFCSKVCLKKFSKNPQAFVAGASSKTAAKR